ncbi:MAG: cadherin-like beta sandwich domain-containing protein [Clostridia bacterium]|nr:cadherin-like beta sandwich domain-containing protein [Clostridia bacterium]
MFSSDKNLRILSVIATLMLLLSFACFAEPDSWSDDPTAVAPTAAPTAAPTQAPTAAPTQAPTVAPRPTRAPTTANNNNNNNQNRSSDNSLRGLSVVGKTENGETVNVELNPVFSPTVYNYNISVPYEVVRLEVSADANSDAASVTIPASLLRIDIGSNNRTEVVVRAENGSTRRYVISTVRSETPTPETTTAAAETTTELVEKVDPELIFPEETTTEPGNAVSTGRFIDNVYAKLGIVFGAGGALLLIIAVSMIIRRKRANGGSEE